MGVRELRKRASANARHHGWRRRNRQKDRDDIPMEAIFNLSAVVAEGQLKTWRRINKIEARHEDMWRATTELIEGLIVGLALKKERAKNNETKG